MTKTVILNSLVNPKVCLHSLSKFFEIKINFSKMANLQRFSLLCPKIIRVQVDFNR